MTPPDLRARLHALISEHVNAAADPQAIADELLAEAISVNAVVGSRHATAALLRRLAGELDGTNG